MSTQDNLRAAAGAMMSMTLGEVLGVRRTEQEFSRMRELTEVAYTTVFDALKLEYATASRQAGRGVEACDGRARIGADYLFARAADGGASGSLAVAHEQSVAREWLRHNDVMRELVHESLRVLSALDEDARSSAGPIGAGLTEAYDRACSQGGDAVAYDALVHKAISSLPLHTQQSLFYGWAKTNTCY